MGDEKKGKVGNVVAEAGILRVGVVLVIEMCLTNGASQGDLDAGDSRLSGQESSPAIEALNTSGRWDGRLGCRSSVSVFGAPISERRIPTFGGVNYGLEHQRNEDNEEEVVDEELGCAPEGCRCILGNGVGAGIFGGGWSRVRSGRGSCRGGEASVEGIERIDPP